MSNHEIEVLNSLTRTLIDSRDGYETCSDLTDDSFVLKREFSRRCGERDALVKEFQSLVRAKGGQPEFNGSAAGASHRGFARFTSLFMDDEKAAISALDDGEEYLADKIEDRLEDDDLSPDTLSLLHRAMISAKDGERFADRLDD